MNNNVRVNGIGFHASTLLYGFLRGGLLLGAWLIPRFLPEASSNLERSLMIVGAFLGAFLLVSFLYGQLYLRGWVKKIYGDYVRISPLTYFDLAFFHFISLKNNKGYSIRFGRRASKFNIILTPDDSSWVLLDPRSGKMFEEEASAEKRFFHYHFEGMAENPKAEDSFYVLGNEDGDPHIFVLDGLAAASVISDAEEAMSAKEKGFILLECPRVKLDEMYLELHKRELLVLLVAKGGKGILYSGEELICNRENRFFID